MGEHHTTEAWYLQIGTPWLGCSNPVPWHQISPPPHTVGLEQLKFISLFTLRSTLSHLMEQGASILPDSLIRFWTASNPAFLTALLSKKWYSWQNIWYRICSMWGSQIKPMCSTANPYSRRHDRLEACCYSISTTYHCRRTVSADSSHALYPPEVPLLAFFCFVSTVSCSWCDPSLCQLMLCSQKQHEFCFCELLLSLLSSVSRAFLFAFFACGGIDSAIFSHIHESAFKI